MSIILSATLGIAFLAAIFTAGGIALLVTVGRSEQDD